MARVVNYYFLHLWQLSKLHPLALSNTFRGERERGVMHVAHLLYFMFDSCTMHVFNMNSRVWEPRSAHGSTYILKLCRNTDIKERDFS